MRGYVGITAHFIAEWSLESVLLSCSRFFGRHAGDNIFQKYEEVLDCFGIRQKIASVTTDNASNMIRAFSLPGLEDNTNEDDSEDDEMDLQASATGDTLDHLPTEHDTCFAHSLQLVIHDGFKSAGQVNKVLAKAGKLVSHVRHSIHASELLEGEKSLQPSNQTRWNSQLTMIRSILSIPESKLHALQAPQPLKSYDMNILADLVEILTPFEEATMLIQGEKCVSASHVIPCIRGLKSHLETMSSDYNCKFVTALKSSFERRMSRYESRPIFPIATTLDPRFKLQWCTPDETENVQSLIKHKMSALGPQSIPPVPETQPSSPPRKRARLVSFMDKTTQPHSQSQPSSPA